LHGHRSITADLHRPDGDLPGFSPCYMHSTPTALSIARLLVNYPAHLHEEGGRRALPP
jgi:hypothetical protein